MKHWKSILAALCVCVLFGMVLQADVIVIRRLFPAAAGFEPTDYDGSWTMGPDSSLNAGVTWDSPPTNFALETEADAAVWTTQRSTWAAGELEANNSVDTTHHLFQSISYDSGSVYTVAVEAKFVELDWLRLAGGGSGQPSTFCDFQNGVTGTLGGGASGDSIAASTDGYYWCAMYFTSDGGELNIRISLAEADTDFILAGNQEGNGVLVRKTAVFAGNVAASSAAAAYEKVDDAQRQWDWSGSAAHLQVGSGSGPETNDATRTADGAALRWHYTTDDYDTVALSDASTVSYLAVIEVDSCTSNRAILSKGGYDQWYLDTSCKPVFASTVGSNTATNALTTGLTYVVGVTVTGTSVTHWLSGTANGSGSVTTRTTGADSALLVGKLSGGSYFEGYIDLVAMGSSAIDHSAAYTAIHDAYESERGLTVE